MPQKHIATPSPLHDNVILANGVSRQYRASCTKISWILCTARCESGQNGPKQLELGENIVVILLSSFAANVFACQEPHVASLLEMPYIKNFWTPWIG